MTFTGWLTIVLFAVILTALALPLGGYMARVYTGERVFLSPLFAGPERFLYRSCGSTEARAGLEAVCEKPV